MKNSTVTLLLLLVTLPLLVQCASQDELNKIHYQLRSLNKKVNDLEATTIDNVQKRQASTSSQMDQLYQNFLQLRSDLEETGHLNRRLTEQNKELENAFKSYAKIEEEKRNAELQRLEEEITEKDKSIDSLAQQIKMQQDNLQAIQRARVEEAKRKAEAAARAAAAAKAKANAASSAARAGTPAHIKADNEKQLYSVSNTSQAASPAPPENTQTAAVPEQQAVSKSATAPPPVKTGGGIAETLYKKGEYREAYREFEKIATDQSNSSAAIDARYMMGECLFSLKEYDQAILDYQNIITNSPSSAKAPAAMLRQGMAFENLNDTDTARILYQKLIASYKDSPEAEKAQQLLDKIK